MMITTRACTWLLILDCVTVVFFTVELILRFLFSPCKRKFFKHFLHICDAVSLLPCYGILTLFFIRYADMGSDALARVVVIMSCIRIIRIFRLFHIAKHIATVRMIGESLKESYWELLILLILLTTASVFYASLLFYVELYIENIEHIPSAIWWALITMTTVGYGDYYPISAGGYVIASLCCLTGILIVALPTPIIVNNFSQLHTTYKTCGWLAQRQKTDAKKESTNKNQLTGNTALKYPLKSAIKHQKGGIKSDRKNCKDINVKTNNKLPGSDECSDGPSQQPRSRSTYKPHSVYSKITSPKIHSQVCDIGSDRENNLKQSVTTTDDTTKNNTTKVSVFASNASDSTDSMMPMEYCIHLWHVHNTNVKSWTLLVYLLLVGYYLTIPCIFSEFQTEMQKS